MQNGQRTGKHPHPIANHGILPTRGTAGFPRTSFATEEIPLALNSTHSVQLLRAGSDGCSRDVYTSGFPDYIRSRPVLYRTRGSVGFKNTHRRDYSSSSGPSLLQQRRSGLTPKSVGAVHQHFSAWTEIQRTDPRAGHDRTCSCILSAIRGSSAFGHRR